MTLLPEDELIDKYLSDEIIDPCEYDAYPLQKLDEFLGNDTND